MKRENGYYWVMAIGDWIIAEFSGGFWFMPGFVNELWSDEDFDEIDENRILRDN